jgi:hypothetical protein
MCGRTACTLAPGALVRACTLGARTEEAATEFDGEDDSFLLEATIPKVDPFTPKNRTAFLYNSFKLTEDKAQYDVDGFGDEDESFLLEASITVESEAPPMAANEEYSCFTPVWRAAPCGGQYRPSANIPPGTYSPVLVWDPARPGPVLQPMLWGLVPPWHPGPAPASHGLSTNNARLEGVEGSKLYSPCLAGRRCVVVCDGFYEWERGPAGKQPFLVSRRPEAGRPGAGDMAAWADRCHTVHS